MSTTTPTSQSDSTPYEDHYLSARDVCSNCLSLIRVERVDPMRGGLTQELDSHLARRRKVTHVAYGPSEAMSESKGVFCQCGVESARERIWSAGDVDRERFRELLKNLVRTATAKDISIKRKETIAYALQKHKDGYSPDDALATALDAGIVAACADESR